MARSAEMDALRRLRQIRDAGKIGGDQVGRSDQIGGVEQLAGQRADAGAGHAAIRDRPVSLCNDINNFDLNLQ